MSEKKISLKRTAELDLVFDIGLQVPVAAELHAIRVHEIRAGLGARQNRVPLEAAQRTLASKAVAVVERNREPAKRPDYATLEIKREDRSLRQRVEQRHAPLGTQVVEVPTSAPPAYRNRRKYETPWLGSNGSSRES